MGKDYAWPHTVRIGIGFMTTHKNYSNWADLREGRVESAEMGTGEGCAS
ncbi:hypothetical protein [Mailhella massiliensis]|uniref:Uncharacterized protein n=1 Tax=Mailhella massiliensis TaxID=1903261 RepID=A0A921DQY2_9BACT|nr:hypothetical protein [Mailhella massiliensis]HJD97039.1 hypothetical protein [Mailhella massiliensis]